MRSPLAPQRLAGHQRQKNKNSNSNEHARTGTQLNNWIDLNPSLSPIMSFCPPSANGRSHITTRMTCSHLHSRAMESGVTGTHFHVLSSRRPRYPIALRSPSTKGSVDSLHAWHPVPARPPAPSASVRPRDMYRSIGRPCSMDHIAVEGYVYSFCYTKRGSWLRLKGSGSGDPVKVTATEETAQ